MLIEGFSAALPQQLGAKAGEHRGEKPAQHVHRPVNAEIDPGPGNRAGNGDKQRARPQAVPEHKGQRKGKADSTVIAWEGVIG